MFVNTFAGLITKIFVKKATISLRKLVTISMINHINRILLAEDDAEEYAKFFTAINSISATIEVIRADDGYSLLNLVQSSLYFDAVFLDINLKYKNGLLTLSEIKEMESFKNVPVIIISKSDYNLNIDIAYKLGATFYVYKPDTSVKLIAILNNIFSSEFFTSGKQPPREDFFIE